ncbi:MAG TPA: AAA family ATPase [Blastocatellia bacterium]|nr:AAA family ATPase [Blastocatellia bacterium]
MSPRRKRRLCLHRPPSGSLPASESVPAFPFSGSVHPGSEHLPPHPQSFADRQPAASAACPLSCRNFGKAERQRLVAETFARFQLTDKQKLYPLNLSGGLQQLIGVARAVIASPRLILADEPTGNLHSAQAREIMELFTKLNQEGATIIQVTHSEVNASSSHRIVRLPDGAVVKE